MLDNLNTVEKTGVVGAIFTIVSASIFGIISFFRWLINVSGEHEKLMEHMQATKDYPVIRQQITTLKEDHTGLLAEVKGLRQDIQDLFKLLIEKNGS